MYNLHCSSKHPNAKTVAFRRLHAAGSIQQHYAHTAGCESGARLFKQRMQSWPLVLTSSLCPPIPSFANLHVLLDRGPLLVTGSACTHSNFAVLCAKYTPVELASIGVERNNDVSVFQVVLQLLRKNSLFLRLSSIGGKTCSCVHIRRTYLLARTRTSSF